jgi:hypothetical protein
MGDLGQLLELIRLEKGSEMEKLKVAILKLLSDGAAEPATQRWLAERFNSNESSKSRVNFAWNLGVHDHELEGQYLTFGSLFFNGMYAAKNVITENVDEITNVCDISETVTEKVYKHIRIFKRTPA